MLNNPAHRLGLHVVALFEALKGLLGLIAGLALLNYIHADLQKVGMEFINAVGLDPTDHYPHALLQVLAGITPRNIEWVAAFAFFYACIRGAEAWGLWKTRGWASWLGVISGGLYLPVEIYEMYQKFTWVRLLIICGNILIIVYLFQTRPHAHKAEGPS